MFPLTSLSCPGEEEAEKGRDEKVVPCGLEREHVSLADSAEIKTVVTSWRRWGRAGLIVFLIPIKPLVRFTPDRDTVAAASRVSLAHGCSWG